MIRHLVARTIQTAAIAAGLALVTLAGCTDDSDITSAPDARTSGFAGDLGAASGPPEDADLARLHTGPRERLASHLTDFIGTPITPEDLRLEDVRKLYSWPATPLLVDAVRDGGKFLVVTIDRPDLPLPTMNLSVPEPLSMLYMNARFVLVLNDAHGPFIETVELAHDGICVARDVYARVPGSTDEPSCSDGDSWDLYEQCLRRVCSPMGCTATIVDCRVSDDCSSCEEPPNKRCEYLACQDGYCTLVEAEVPADSPCPSDECTFSSCDDAGGVIQDIFGD